MGLPRTDNTGRNWSMVDSHFQHEMVERLLINALKSFLQFQCEFNQFFQMIPSNGAGIIWFGVPQIVYTTGCHIRWANCFDLSHILELCHSKELSMGIIIFFFSFFLLLNYWNVGHWNQCYNVLLLASQPDTLSISITLGMKPVIFGSAFLDENKMDLCTLDFYVWK